MATGGRIPTSTPSLPLPPAHSTHNDSLHTPDTSALFVSTLTADRSGSGFSSLEDLLYFSGITQSTSASFPPPLNASLSPGATPLQGTIAQNHEQSQDTGVPPEAKRPRLNSVSSLPSLLPISPTTSTTAQCSSLPPNIRVSALPASITAPRAQTASSTALPGRLPPTPRASSPLTPPTSSIRAVSPIHTSSPTSSHSSWKFKVPSLPAQHVTSQTPPTIPSLCPTPSSMSRPPAPTSCSGTAATLPPTPPTIPSTAPPTAPPQCCTAAALPPPVVVPSVLARSTAALSLPSAGGTVPPPVPTLPLAPPALSATPGGTSTTSTTSSSSSSSSSSVSSLILPNDPGQRALLVQLIQMYRQSQALGDQGSQARIKQQLNLLLQSQKAAATPTTALPTVPAATPPHSAGRQNNHVVSQSTLTVLQSPAAAITSKPSPSPSSSSSLLAGSSKPSPSPSPSSLLLAGSNKPADPAACISLATSFPTSSTSICNPVSFSLPTTAAPFPLATSTTAPFSLPTHTSTSAPFSLPAHTSTSAPFSLPAHTSTSAPFSLPAHTSTSAPFSTTSLSNYTQEHTITSTPSLLPTTINRGASSSPANALKAAALYNLRLRQLQLFLQSLPEDQRPKSVPELRNLIQKSGGQLNTLGPAPSTSLPQPSPPTSHAPSPSRPSLPLSLPAQSQVLPPPQPSLPQPTLPPPNPPLQPAGAVQSSAVVCVAGGVQPAPAPGHQVFSHSPSGPGGPSAPAQVLTKSLPTAAGATSLPVTNSLASPVTISSNQNEPIKPGVPTPLPPGLNPETLAVLCRMPDSELQKLNLPVPLMTAIRVWRVQQSNNTLRGRKAAVQQATGLPVIIPPTQLSSAPPPAPHASAPLPTPPSQLFPPPPPAAAPASSLSSSVPVLPARPPPPTASGQHSQNDVHTSQSVMMPSLEGFPPRSLHAYIPGVAVESSFSGARASAPPPYSHSTSHPVSRPLTRHQLRVEQSRVEKERAAALNKALQSSEEARIAYRFTMLLDKMQNQLLRPDTHTPFKSLHDVIARLLPYHMWSEAEPPPGAIEKADAVYESVAQVLMSRSYGLMSQYQQLLYQDSPESTEVMKTCLDKLFIETEQERKEQENRERQQAAQIAEDLSLIAEDTGLHFDTDFSLGDVMNSDPMLTFDPGIT